MKQLYIQPQTKTELAQCVMVLATSMLDNNTGSQSITPVDDEYNGEFAVKEYSFGDDIME
jgi:hypothetical protein